MCELHFHFPLSKVSKRHFYGELFLRCFLWRNFRTKHISTRLTPSLYSAHSFSIPFSLALFSFRRGKFQGKNVNRTHSLCLESAWNIPLRQFNLIHIKLSNLCRNNKMPKMYLYFIYYACVFVCL